MAEKTASVLILPRLPEILKKYRGGLGERCGLRIDGQFFMLASLLLAATVSGGCARHRHALSVPVRPVVEESESERVPCLWPVNAPAQKITSVFGEKRSGGRVHKGLDIAVPRGTPVKASASGITSFSGEQGGYGKIVIVDHCNGYETAYAHLDAILTSRGIKVRRGSKIGLAGASGNATGPHLHYEVRCNSKCVNPEPYLP